MPLTADDEDAPWTSIRATHGVLPEKYWFKVVDGAIALKDTKGSYFKNELVRPSVFQYRLPPYPKAHEADVVRRLFDEAERDEKTLVVHLFSMPSADDHFFGEWLVHAADRRVYPPFVTLRRLKSQSPALQSKYRLKKRERSWSEAQHADELAAWLPDDWLVAHEPSVAIDLDAPLVKDGVERDFSGDQYTVDYLASDPSGVRRLCVESKASLDDATAPRAIEKCVALRDKHMCRVVTFADHGAALRVVDFGPPHGGAGVHAQYADVAAFRAALGMA